METRKSKMEDGDMRVESREWGRRGNGDGGMETGEWRRSQRRGEREKGKWEIGTEGKKRGKRVRVTERM